MEPKRRELPLRIAILVASHDTLLDVVGPYQVFFQATSEGGRPTGGELGRYEIHVINPGNRTIARSRRGIGLVCTDSVSSFRGPIDTLVVAGSNILTGWPPDPGLVRWIVDQAPKTRRVASVCSGAFLLAEAGLLDGRRATTHWRYVEELARRYPRVTVEPDPIYVRDGKIYTSAGMTAGTDLALALVEEDFGPAVALDVARSMVLYLRRPGGQSQFSTALRRQLPELSPLKRVEQWIVEHLDEGLSVDRLASVVGMSPRNFARVFVREAGVTPAKYVEEIRLEEARRRLEVGADTVEQVAAGCGYGSVDSLQRHFAFCLRTTPAEYRKRFKSALRA